MRAVELGDPLSCLPVAFFERPPLEVAPELLHKLLVGPDGRCGRIVEVEAYGGEDDAGSHGWRGVTPRTEVMFGPAGHWYVYLSYGVHWCANIVVEGEGTCGAVLLRAVEPIDGIEHMRQARNGRPDRELANGPGKLTQAMGVDGSLDGQLMATSALRILDDGDDVLAVEATPRIGLSEGRGETLPWRFVVA